MRQTHTDNVICWGDYWVECPRCGFDYRKSEMVLEYTGLEVCKDCCDNHPQTPSKGGRVK